MATDLPPTSRTAEPARPLRVLYVDGVGPFGGASRSLFEVVRALPPGTVKPLFLAADGSALEFYRQLTDEFVITRGLTRFDNTRYSHYRGVRWLVVLRELYHIPFMLRAVREAKRRWGAVDVIHANEITEIIPLLLVAKAFGAPSLVHVRSMQRRDDQSWRSRWLRRQLREKVSGIIAIDENVRSTLPADVDVTVIHNSFTPAKAPNPDEAFIARLDKLRPDALKVGFIGNLHHGKGLMDLLEAAKILTDQGRDVEFIIIGGETRQDSGLKARLLRMLGLAQNVQEHLTQRIAELGVGDRFHLFGSTKDIQRVYERLDVLCFPSHFDAAGRPVFEAAYSGVPSIASISDPRPDTLDHGETGLAIPAKNPQKLAEAILHFADNRDEVRRMGENARQLAHRNFDPAANSRQLLSLYMKLASQGLQSRPGSTGKD
jgi:glycosyltransferase involved in cell wall biosynthesis